MIAGETGEYQNTLAALMNYLSVRTAFLKNPLERFVILFISMADRFIWMAPTLMRWWA